MLLGLRVYSKRMNDGSGRLIESSLSVLSILNVKLNTMSHKGSLYSLYTDAPRAPRSEESEDSSVAYARGRCRARSSVTWVRGDHVIVRGGAYPLVLNRWP
jgi:hypothetical protein